MKINNISSVNFNGIHINASENKSNKYLYNQIQEITNVYKVPATFRTYSIELPTVTNEIIKKLTELGIKFV